VQSSSALLPRQQLRLPVLLTSAALEHDGRLRVVVVHYPVLLRWADWRAGRHPTTHLLASSPPGALTCSIAGGRESMVELGTLLRV
jgi:hypothetical protein